MIIVGDINRQLCAQPEPDQAAQPAKCTTTIATSAVKHLMLKDAQLVIPGTQADGINLYTNYADQNPDFCGSNKFSSGNLGECAADPTTLQDSAVKSGRWVFTVNGVKAPHWEIAEDRYEVWRVQNGSANVTYHLSLQALAYGSSIAEKAPFQVLDMDGAGLVPRTSSESLTLPTTTDILLMPGSRADLLVQAPRKNRTDVTYALVNDNFQTGYVASDADVWPHIQLATVTFRASRQSVDARASAGPAGAAELEVAVKPPVDEGKLAQDLSQQCIGLDDATLTDQERQFYHDHLHVGAPWRRRIYFGVYDKTNTFALGDTLIDDNGNEFDKFGRPITPTHQVMLSTFAMGDSKTSLCVRKDAQDEIWELVNVSNEVHNFHIHQVKFSVVRIAAGPHAADPVMRTPSPIDAVDLPGKLLFKTGLADLQHDTIVVPRGQTSCTDSLRFIDDQHFEIDRANPQNACDGTGSGADISGMIQIRLNFNGNQMAAYDDGAGKLRHAKFVYHCHILEHEDKGMMAGITVIDPDVYR
jgi:FtsP/CotA-like multicopper oxidase with cupredoxin domain